MKYYLITDTHFNHEAMIEFCGRPENFNEIIMKGLKNLPDNIYLIHLGDICIGKDEEVHNKLSSLPYKKILVRGNHDNKSNSWYLEHGWDFVCDQFTFEYGGKKILFSHYPVAWDGYYDLNIHGHFHNSDHRRHEEHFLKLKNGYQKLLAIEYTNYLPVSLESFIK